MQLYLSTQRLNVCLITYSFEAVQVHESLVQTVVVLSSVLLWLASHGACSI